MPTDLLLIDDSLTDLRLLIEMASALKLRISVAFDGKKGYHQAVLQQPWLILLDVRMPGVDGFATCRLLKANPATSLIPIIFLTAANSLDERLEGFALGAVDYIGKPFHEAEVLARIGVHIPLSHKTGEAADAGPPQEGAAEASQQAILVRAAKDILNERLGDPPTLDELARLIGSNRRQINEAFQACCGQPTFGWLREERLRRAHHLVCTTESPISLIGEHLGYGTPANFTRAFHDRFGFSPRELRRSLWVARQSDEQDATG